MKKHCISYPTESLIFLFIVLGLFVSISFHFTLLLLKLEHAVITTDLLNQNPTKKVMLQCKKIVLIRCRKWLSFQSAEYSHH